MEKNEVIELFPNECDFSYRRSIFNSSMRGKYYIYQVDFLLKTGTIEGELYHSLQSYLDAENITSREPKVLADAVRKVRDSKLPDPKFIASSGSFFKNVYVSESEVEDLDKRGIPHHGTKVNTGWLIENSGIKGKIFHGFKVSDKAALVLINESGKSYEDLEKAVKEISHIVYKKFGFRLEQEPNVIGKEDVK
jgi:UDP-N-acetylmuramate dehydrogenase